MGQILLTTKELNLADLMGRQTNQEWEHLRRETTTNLLQCTIFGHSNLLPNHAKSYKINLLPLVGLVAQRLEQRTHNENPPVGNIGVPVGFNGLAAATTLSFSIIARLTTQKQRNTRSDSTLMPSFVRLSLI
jgi:hypothetical protein